MATKKKTSSKSKSLSKKTSNKKTLSAKSNEKKVAGLKPSAKKTANKKQVKAKPAQKSAAKAVQKKSPVQKKSSAKSKKGSSQKVQSRARFNKNVTKTSSSGRLSPTLKATHQRANSPAAEPLSLSPLADYVLVEILAQERRTSGGLIIPDTVGEMGDYLEGKVLAIGPGQVNKKGQRRPLSVAVGEKVMFPRWVGHRFDQSGFHYIILRESELLGVKVN